MALQGALLGGLYAAHGVAEAMRKNMEFRYMDMRERENSRRAEEALALQRFQAETSAMMQAKQLAQREKQFLDAKAEWEAKMAFEQEKFLEQKKQWKEQFPLEERKVAAAEETARARGTSAEASKVRAGAYARRPAPGQNRAARPDTIINNYRAAYVRAFNDLVRNKTENFIDITRDPQTLKDIRKQAREIARESVADQLEFYNQSLTVDDMALTGLSPLGELDVENLAGNVEDQALKEGTTEAWDQLRSSPGFTSRFQKLQLTEQELEILKVHDPEMYNVYLGLLGKRPAQTEQPKIQLGGFNLPRTR